MNIWALSFAYVRRRRLATFLNVALLAQGTAVLVVLLLMGHQFQERLERDGRGVDLVVGAEGSPLQLILSAVYQLDVPTGNIPLAEAEAVLRRPEVAGGIPLSLGDSYRGVRVIGTTPEYVTHFGSPAVEGRLWNADFEAVVGARVARQFGLRVGQTIVTAHGLAASGPRHHAHPLTITGILEPTGSVIDRVILTSQETIWESHHAAGPEPERQITALLIRFRSPAAAALLPRRINEIPNLMAASPAYETARLLRLLGVGLETVRIIGAMLILSGGLSLFITLLTSIRARRKDLALMRTLGASPGFLLRHVLLESLLLAGFGTGLGLLLGHGVTEILGRWSERATQVAFSGAQPVAAELWLVGVAGVVAVAAALAPALMAYRTDIAAVLNREGA